MNPQWTFLVYIAGDNDLSAKADQDVAEMEAGCPADLHVGIHLDRLNQDTLTLSIENNAGVVINSVPDQNAGEPAVLTAFLDWGQAAFGDSSYAVILSNHGNGWVKFTRAALGEQTIVSTRRDAKFLGGMRYAYFTTIIEQGVRRYEEKLEFVGYDASIALDVTSHDSLEGTELQGALERSLTARKAAIIGCDACFMSMLEVVYDLRNIGEVFIGSQEIEETEGWPYREILAGFGDNLDPEAAARVITGAFRGAMPNGSQATLSAIRLNQIGPLTAALDALGTTLLPLLPAQLIPIAIAKANTKFFKVFDFIDLLDFTGQLQSELPAEAAVVNAARAVSAAVTAAVVDTSNDAAATKAHGISIYIPDGPVNPDYPAMALTAAAPNWSRFVQEYGRLR
jgi:hypothetical protein